MIEIIYNQFDGLYPKQKEIFEFDKRGYRFAFVEACTKSGKTFGALIWLFEKALQGNKNYNYWWVAPTFSQTGDAWKRMKDGLTQSKEFPRFAFSVNNTKLTITLLNGAVITFKSGDNFDALMGSDVQNVVIDEASLVKEEAWYNIQSTLTATSGTCVAIANLNGKNNWHYKMCRRAERKENTKDWIYHRLTCYDAIAGGRYLEHDLQVFKNTMSEGRFNELYLCIPGDSGVNPFGINNIGKCIIEEEEIEDHNVVCYGCDLASRVDFTSVIGLNKYKQVVAKHQFKGNWIEIENKLTKIIGNVPALIDETSCGAPVFERLQESIPNITGFTFTNKSKGEIIELLAVAIQNKEVTFTDSWLVKELEFFEIEQIKNSQKYKYNASKGHDDGVIALSLANYHFAEVGNKVEFALVF